MDDLPFRNGVLDENAMYLRLNCKQNIHCELMLVKNALYPYRRSIESRNSDTVPVINLLDPETIITYTESSLLVMLTLHLSQST